MIGVCLLSLSESSLVLMCLSQPPLTQANLKLLSPEPALISDSKVTIVFAIYFSNVCHCCEIKPPLKHQYSQLNGGLFLNE